MTKINHLKHGDRLGAQQDFEQQERKLGSSRL